MLTRLVLVILIALAVGVPFVLPYIPAAGVEQPERVTEKPPFASSDQDSLLEVRTSRFEPISYTSSIEVTAATSADKVRQIRSEVAGKIEVLTTKRGDRVSAGDVLARIAAETRTSQSAQAEASVEQARVDLESTRQLVEQGVLASNRLASAEAAYQAALAGLDQANQQLGDLEIISAVSGIVTEVATEEGSNISPGEQMMTIISLDPIKVLARVSEAEIANVAMGQTIDVVLATGDQFDAVVSYIAPSANPATRTFEIEASAPNPDFAIRDGVTATVQIDRPSEEAFKIKQSTLVTDEEGHLGVRFVDPDGRVQFAAIELLETTLENAWVTGLSADMDVLVVGQRFAEVGDKVTARDARDVPSADQSVANRLDGE